MSNSKINNKVYQSIYGAEDLITPTQYIAELIISRQSKFLKVSLPNRFWTDSSYVDWKKKYLNQKRRADALVKAGYEIKVIIKAIMSDRGKNICSLFNKNLDSILEEEQRKLDVEAKLAQSHSIVVSNPNVVAPTTTVKPNRLSKLRDE